MDPAAVLDHEYMVAAYIITWVIQLSYVVWLACKWRAQKHAARRSEHAQH